MITKQEAENLLQQYFNVNKPIIKAEFRSIYRTKVRELHPDLSGADTTKEFQDFQAVYEKLINCDIFKDSSLFVSTVEGISISELGLGLGPLVNTVECSHCNGNGYNVEYGYKTEYCEDCNEYGVPFGKKICPQCRGRRGFTSIKGYHVICMTCKDEGSIVDRKRKIKSHWDFFTPFCSSCNGTKRKRISDIEQKLYSKCSYCNGTGEIRIYNPVITKARLKK